MTDQSELIIEQIEIGPMQNFTYIVGSRSTREVVIVDPAWFDRLPESGEEEDDMLDLALGLSRTSRLGCQITITKELDGLVVTLPALTRDVR